jgi:putative hydrolase of the HAD superfamily
MLKAILFDWGDTLMADIPGQEGPMYSWPKVEIVPNADSCLRELSRQFPIYLATNAKDSSKDDIKKALSRVHLEKYLMDVFCFQEIQAMKPSQYFFQYVFKKTNFHPNELLFIGDDLEKDFLGAKKYGINAILYDPREKRLDIPDRVTDLAEIPLFIKAQNNYCL